MVNVLFICKTFLTGWRKAKLMTANDEIMAMLKERAKRIILLREAFRLSRPEFAKALGIPHGTLQNWEEARHGGLSERGALRLIQALNEKLNIECRLEWLLYGTEPAPHILTTLSILPFGNQPLFLQEEAIIAQELSFFQKLNPNAVDCIITDESMLPCFKPGDHVAGRRFFDQEIDKTINQPCIVHTPENASVLVRIVQIGSEKGLYTLSCTNPAAIKEPVIKNIKLLSTAPIIWMRRKGMTYKL